MTARSRASASSSRPPRDQARPHLGEILGARRREPSHRNPMKSGITRQTCVHHPLILATPKASPVVGYLMHNDQMMVGLDGNLNVVADDRLRRQPAAPARRRRLVPQAHDAARASIIPRWRCLPPGPADIADRSRCPLDGHQRPRFRRAGREQPASRAASAIAVNQPRRRLRCGALVPSMLGFGRQFLPRTVNQKASRSSSGSLVKFAAMRRASSRVSRLIAERCDAAICPNRGEAEVRGLRLKRR